MAKSGRKRKPGARTANGKRPSRAGYVPLIDKGTERVQAIQALYGQDNADAIGRAYRSGLLGEGAPAKAMLDTARRISNVYWAAYSNGGYQCPLGERTFGGGNPDHEAIKRREEWLNDCLTRIRNMGPGVNRAFRQLTIDVNPDCGPDWMDRLIWASRKGIGADIADQQTLRAALDALEVLAS